MKVRRCFYCGIEMMPVGYWVSVGRPHPDAETLEHVVPRGKGIKRSHKLNKVRACWTCNNRKGGMDPLEWLVVCPNYGVIRLQQLLPQLGYAGWQVSRAMAERAAANN